MEIMGSKENLLKIKIIKEQGSLVYFLPWLLCSGCFLQVTKLNIKTLFKIECYKVIYWGGGIEPCEYNFMNSYCVFTIITLL